MKLEKENGLIQALTVEADTLNALSGAVQIALVGHNKITHYNMAEDGSSLELRWTRHSMCEKLPFPLIDRDEITAFIEKWLLTTAVYPEAEYDGDIDYVAGFRVTTGDFYSVLKIEPIWIAYGK